MLVIAEKGSNRRFRGNIDDDFKIETIPEPTLNFFFTKVLESQN